MAMLRIVLSRFQVHVSAHAARVIFLCGHLLVHFILSHRSIPNPALKQILGRSCRLPYFGPDYHVCRCMSLPIQLESLLCGHLLVHFVTSYKFIPKLCPKQIRGISSRLPCLGSYFHVCRCMSLPIQKDSFLVRPPARAFWLVLQIHP